MDSLISIIIPVYNVEKYLRRCIDSVLGQTYDKLEIILVDDGSTDNSGRICDEYREKDQRIIVIHKENGGLSEARNFGIEKRSGEYISFVDSDDWIEGDYVELLYRSIIENNADMAIAGNYIRFSHGRTITVSACGKDVLSGEQTLDALVWNKNGIDVAAWAKLYKKTLFNDVKYPVGELFEDTATTYKLIDRCERVAVCPTPVYNYVKREGSITKGNFSVKKMDLIEATRRMTNYIRIKYPKLAEGCDRRLMWAYLSTLSQLVVSDDGRFPYIKTYLLTYITINRKRVLKFGLTPFRDKLGLIVVGFGYRFYKFVWKLYILVGGRR